MIKKLILLACISISSTACAEIDKNKITPTYSSENKTNRYFTEAMALEQQEQVKTLIYKKWYFEESLLKDGNPNKVVTSCNTLFNALDEGFNAFSYREQGVIKAMNKVCLIWSHMGELNASDASFLTDFEHGSALPKQMPPELALIISNDDERRLASASSWEEMSRVKEVQSLNKDQAIYYDNSGGIQKLTVMAKGDYNNDGIEDMVLYMDNSVEEGSYGSTYGYVVTRLAADAPYTLIKQF
ncbi:MULTISPECIES: hypothetical protein [unclassified Pseudoalteromonas]|uniref:hypothetical protein n=1 Tax=unclassified Pseudoalteromonas TaxID=194690 RepID=UPI000BBE1207|nr:hypothetical protein [Pseudoalteromonas sp. 1_2015MBL_MicDiv]ATG79574.1 hypothetical protein AOR04_18655 [Pseudoalteromonas sp. 1_2015MBL_MicDiv]